MALFFPPACPVCGDELPDGISTVCNKCRWNAPLTGFWKQVDNPVARKFWGTIPIVNASSFIFFVHGSGFRDLIHGFKYHGRWRQAENMGEWFGAEMARSGLYADVDVIVPVPLHIRKTLKRGYNQSDYIARGMARQLGIKVDSRSVTRRVHNPSQALKQHRERWDNVKGIFSVPNPHRLAGKHILIVDDVLTTGATISSCAEEIIRVVPDCRISIATLAVSKNDIEIA